MHRTNAAVRLATYVAAADELEATVARQRALLDTLEWSFKAFNGAGFVPACPSCGGLKPHGHPFNTPGREGHRPGCLLAAELRGVE